MERLELFPFKTRASSISTFMRLLCEAELSIMPRMATMLIWESLQDWPEGNG